MVVEVEVAPDLCPLGYEPGEHRTEHGNKRGGVCSAREPTGRKKSRTVSGAASSIRRSDEGASTNGSTHSAPWCSLASKASP